LFMRQIAGTSEIYKKTEICEQMRSEVQATFQNVLNELGTEKHQAPALELPSQTDEIKQIMKEKVFDQDIRNRGMEITGFIVESVTLDEESYKKIDTYELSSNSYMQQGALVGSYSEALKNAANNPNGAATGMMGVGMVNMASNGVVGAATTNPFTNTENSRIDLSNKEQSTTPVENNNKTPQKANFCTNCGTPVTGNFCGNCGTKVAK